VMIPYGRHQIAQADVDAVLEVLHSDFLTQGPVVPRFERALANFCGVRYGVAVNSATSALHIACLALGLGSGDWLWTSPNTFVASANVAKYCGANIDFVDIDPQTYNICAQRLEKKLEQAERDGKLPKIVMPVHFAGQPCDMPTIRALSFKYGFKIIEDASHATGASYSGTKVGSCAHSEVTVFSFHPVKIITTGEGGIAMTNDEFLAARLQRLRSHGITTDKSLMRSRPADEIWNYQQIDLGFNYRMTDIQAAIGLSQLSRLNEIINRRHDVAERYHRAFALLPITRPFQADGVRSSYHLYPIRVNTRESGKTQRQMYDALWSSGVAVNIHYIPVHRHPFYELLGFNKGDFPEAESFHKEVISLPIYANFESSKQDVVIKAVESTMRS
jgi:UDP-4-amino-4,6-dideoxy-N-acetyl-beta-L-altrosamine transaminase